ncbi:unnamed protein product, partial [Mesorhabditis belari]|uniref:Anti-proliferative protein domain-containing protein n=1 Tax=Mesorhabditis belari TaxID=2138241 RepID=A0AAF3F386_9BILA
MYTEVKELVNLIARLLLTKVPRTKVCIFAEYYANQLILRFSANWDVHDAVIGDKIRVLILRDGDELDRDLQCSADTMLVRKDILMKQIPDGFSVRIGPGYVGYSVNECSPLIHLWNGPINADDNYNPFPEFVLKWQSSNSGTTTNMGIGKGVRGGAIYGRGNMDDGSKLDVHDFVPLRLIVRPFLTHGPINPYFHGSLYEKSFEYTGKEDANVEVGHFAMTRFGSQKKRPDYELIQRIQRQVKPEASIDHEGMPPPPQAFADKPSPAPIQYLPFHSKIKDNVVLCNSGQQQNMFGSASDVKITQDESSNTMAFLQGINKSGGLNGAINGAQIIQNTYGAWCPNISPVKKTEFQ